ncbi:MAG TPA: sulfurtransferase [Burkholderiaceae bacterium]|nr:sulfurtransferase [Burkholderiaceae bacterium]
MKTWTILIGADELAGAIDRCVVIDCRHDLTNPPLGRAAYDAAHIPGARFMSQDTDLASAKNGRNGRHPLPDPDALAQRLRAAGLHRGQQLVACDQANGLYASRLWWLARWLGHREVAVLDGGVDAWQRAGYPLTAEVPLPAAPGDFVRGPALAEAMDVSAMVENLASRRRLVIDARAAERYRGEVEPMDPVAGHIPGALNHVSSQNVRPDGRFKPAEVLRASFEALLAGRPAGDVVHSCGSGISACHNLIAMEAAGLTGSRLYGGSWSEWVADPSRPVATGPSPDGEARG